MTETAARGIAAGWESGREQARRAARCLAVASGIGLLGAVGAAPAWAASTHSASSRFGGEGSGAGQLFSPAGVAVNQHTHAIYVADSGNHRVDEFEASGAFVRAWGWGVAGGVEFEECTPASIMGCEEGLSGSGAGQFESPVFIAVDNSAGASAGDVYVGDPADDLVTKFSAEGALQKSWGDTTPTANGQLAGVATSAGSFGEMSGIAVSTTGTLDVFSKNDVTAQFSQAGSFTGEVPMGERGTEPKGLAVDASGDLFKANGNSTIDEFTSAGTDLGTVTLNEGSASGFAVNTATGSLYVSQGGFVEQFAFKEATVVEQPGGTTCTFLPAEGCPPTDSFGGGGLSGGVGVGVDSSNDTVYVSDASGHVDAFVAGSPTGRATGLRATSAVLNGTVDPNGAQPSVCRFEYVTKTAFEATGFTDLSSGGEAACVPPAASIPPDSEEHAVSAEVSGLAEGESYVFRLTAGSASSGPVFGNPQGFTTTTPPQIVPGSAAALNLTPSAVDLEARINPENGATSYRIEYGTSTAYGSSVPAGEAEIGEGQLPVRVTQHVTGLSPDTTYHWRVVASNSAGTATGADHTFIYDRSGPGLPDGRAYELVTPARKNGALIGNYPEGFFPGISADGSRLILGAVQCFGGAQSCTVTRQAIGTIYSFTRGSAGWTATPLAPPATEVRESTWWVASAETGAALFSGPTPPFGEDDFYARSPGGTFTKIGPLSLPSAGPNLAAVQSTRVATSADFRRVYFQTEPVWPFATSTPQLSTSLFEYDGPSSEPSLVGVSGGPGTRDLISACETEFGGFEQTRAGGTVSADGRILYFTVQPCAEGTGSNSGHAVPVPELFARIDGGEADAHTVAISEPRAPQISSPEPHDDCTSAECLENTSPTPESEAKDWRRATFEATSNDGSKVLFVSGQQLTNSASQDASESDQNVPCLADEEGSNGCNLYLYDLDLPSGHRLLDVTDGGAVAGGPRVQGVLAFSSDGSHAYFVAKGVLTNRPNLDGKSAQNGGENLYVYVPHGEEAGHLAFITTLSASAANVAQLTEGPGDPANVTPDGNFFVFTTADDLTPDDTRSNGQLQIFRYDAESGQLARVSIGERGYNDNGNAGAGNAFIAPAFRRYAVPGTEAPGLRRLDPTMSDDGSRVFFMSPVALTAGALNSVAIGENVAEHEIEYAENVYEWEQPGVGSCPAEQSSGCVFLLSDGRDTSTAPAGEACFPYFSSVCLIGSDASGSNAFFTTADPLLPADTDTELDFYDARICDPQHGNPCIAAATSQLPCLGEACHGTPPASPSLLSPPSASFNGNGNAASGPPGKPKTPAQIRAEKLAKALKACKKDKRKAKRKRCEATARKRYGSAKKAKKASNDRRSKS